MSENGVGVGFDIGNEAVKSIKCIKIIGATEGKTR